MSRAAKRKGDRKMKRAPGVFIFFAVCALVFMVALAIPATAATFTVNTTNGQKRGVCPRWMQTRSKYNLRTQKPRRQEQR
jgi:hypothetical protein